MSGLIKDFTPLYSYEQTAAQVPEVREEIANLLTLLNTHQLIVRGGVELYKQKEGYKPVELADAIGYDILDHVDLSFFMTRVLANFAHDAFKKGDVIEDIAKTLRDFKASDEESNRLLEENWLANQDLLENIIFLYSEFLYKVFLNNPYKQGNTLHH